MAKIETISDSLEFAKEIAYDFEINNPLPSEVQILGALQIMDAQLHGSGQDVRGMFFVESCLLIPEDELDIMFMDDRSIADNALPPSVVKARISRFNWLGSINMSGFGIRLHGLDIVEPKRKHEPTTFIPLQFVDLRLAT